MIKYGNMFIFNKAGKWGPFTINPRRYPAGIIGYPHIVCTDDKLISIPQYSIVSINNIYEIVRSNPNMTKEKIVSRIREYWDDDTLTAIELERLNSRGGA